MIEVKEFYRGRATNEQAIVPGQYAEDDPRLFGLADFLVETGRAERFGGPAEVQQPDQRGGEQQEPGQDSQSGEDEKPEEQGEAQQESADQQAAGDQSAEATPEVDAEGNPITNTSDEIDETGRPKVKRKN